MNKKDVAICAIAGIISAFLYNSQVLSFLFLIPVQYIFISRSGFRGVLAAIISLVASCIIFAFWIPGEQLADVGTWARMALIPALLLGGLWWINTPALLKLGHGYRVIVPSAVIAIIFAFPLYSFLHNPDVLSYLESLVTQFYTLAQINQDSWATISPGGSIQAFVRIVLDFMLNTYAGWLCLLYMITLRISSRFLRPRYGASRKLVPSLDQVKAAPELIWGFIFAWVVVFIFGLAFRNEILEPIAWNVAIVISLLYAEAGAGIISFALRRLKISVMMRIILLIFGIIGLLLPVPRLIILGSVVLLGVTEHWIGYRVPKETDDEGNT